MSGIILSPELRELIGRVAEYPHGLGFLNQADLETVAVTLEVHPFVVAEARRLLATREGRAAVIAEVGRQRAAGPPSETTARAPATPARPMGVKELLRRAQGHPLGLSFVTGAPFETVAVTFRAHPFVVLQARTLLERREERKGNRRPASGD